MDKSIFNQIFESYRKKDFVYNIRLEPILSMDLNIDDQIINNYQNPKNITSLFYEGFGYDL